MPDKAILKKMTVMALALTAFLCLTASVEAKPEPLGWYERYYYTQTIPQGYAYYHQHCMEGAIFGSARLISSTGAARLTYLWQAPWLFVNIDNLDTKAITVKWEESFYLV